MHSTHFKNQIVTMILIYFEFYSEKIDQITEIQYINACILLFLLVIYELIVVNTSYLVIFLLIILCLLSTITIIWNLLNETLSKFVTYLNLIRLIDQLLLH